MSFATTKKKGSIMSDHYGEVAADHGAVIRIEHRMRGDGERSWWLYVRDGQVIVHVELDHGDVVDLAEQLSTWLELHSMSAADTSVLACSTSSRHTIRALLESDIRVRNKESQP